MRSLITACTLCLLVFAVSTDTRAAAYTIDADSIYRHIEVLAHDSLEGREVGEPGEWKAADYIINEFTEIGLAPAGDDGNWRQGFEFIKKIEIGETTRLSVNGVELKLEEEYEPFPQSASTEFSFDEIVPVGYGITDEGGFYDDYEGLDVAGKAVLVARYYPEDTAAYPHTDFNKYSSLTDKIRNAREHDVAGLFFYTPPEHDDTLIMMSATRVTPKEFPIIFLRRAAFERLGVSLDDPRSFAVEGVTELNKIHDTGYNVAGVLEGQTDTAIIIGAHYDHLGWGGPGSGSRYLGTEPMIHNGADDNASGTAAVIELARYFATRKEQLRHSMTFVAFSGEESGLLGSSHYSRSMPEDMAVHMMINMDMIGRLRDQDKGLAIFGTGTAEEFASYFDTLTNDRIKLTSKESGTGPSDHTAFYNRGIPVLHFFTGAHEDYHKPQDDIELIDPDGIVRVTEIITGIVEHFDDHTGALTFQKTKSPERTRMSFSVTLGIMPDYISEVKGLRVDGVSPDRPGERAGLKTGDVIVKMGDYQVDDIYAYMNALGKFRKGDSIVVVVERDGTPVDLDVVFE
ncbi:M28 family peptidase [candidate division GN15 bacterium]|nr:M28 family peptidase [candidate division GN15 bacterium]